MKRARPALVGVLLTLGIGGFALGQFAPQIWPADQDGGQNKLFDVSSVEIDSAMSGGDSCLASPDSILFSPASPGTNVSIKRSAQNGFGGFTLSCDNQAGFLDEGASLNRLLMTAQGLDNGGDTFYGASYFGVRTDSVGAYPGNRDNQQFYSALQSVYELSAHVDFTTLPGTTPLDSYYWRGQNVGVDGTSGNNTRPDGISWFTFDTPTLTTLHGFSATGYETVEIRGVPAGGASPAYGLRIYGGSSDLSERVAGTIVLDGLGGNGTRCVQVDNTGTMALAPAACGSGSGTVTAVTATPPIFITGGASPTPNVTEQGAIVSGSTSTTAQNIGAIATAPLGCVTSGGVCTVDGLTLSGGLHFNAGTGAETLDSFTCGAGAFVNSSSTSGLACGTPTGDHKILVDGADTTPDYLDGKVINDATLTATIINPGANEAKQFGRAHISGDCDVPAASNACTLATVATAGTYGSGVNVLRSVTINAKGLTSAIATSNKPQALSFNWAMNQTGLSMGQDRSTLYFPGVSQAPQATLTAVAGTAVTTTMAAGWASNNSPPTIPLRDAYNGVQVNVDVPIVAASGTGSATLTFALYAVTTNPAVAGNYALMCGPMSMSVAAGPQSSFQALGCSATSLASASSLVLLAYRTDVNGAMTITNLMFEADAQVWATP